MDVLGQAHEALTDYALGLAEGGQEGVLTAALTLLDRMAEAITQVRVVGDVEATETRRRPRPPRGPKRAR